MQLEIKTEGVEFVVSRAPQPKNDNDGRQKTDRETGAPSHVTELVMMDKRGAEVIEVTTAGEPRGELAASGHVAQARRDARKHQRAR
jgi:hypothetical protein